MKHLKFATLTTTVFLLALTKAYAQGPVVVAECPQNYKGALVDIRLSFAVSTGCPLLEDAELRELVYRHFHGTTFAGAPGTCFSGQITEGTITLEGRAPADVSGSTSESAQRLLPEAASLGNALPVPNFPLFINGTTAVPPFISGGAATVVTLASEDNKLNGLRLVLEDRFTVNAATGLDTEDFSVIGAEKGHASGRLVGTALTNGMGTFFSPFDISGSFCLSVR